MKDTPNKIFVITVPQFGVNDEFAEVVQWYVSDETQVTSGQKLCALETAKALYDIDAEATGYVVHIAEVESQVNISQPIALIGSDLKTLKTEKQRYLNLAGKKSRAERATKDHVEATQKAKGTALRLGVDLSKISATGIIREQDVIHYYNKEVAEPPPQKPVELSWDTSRKPVVIYGAGKGGVTLKECLDLQETYQVVCFIDDNPAHPKSLCELPVYHSSNLTKIVQQGVCNLACEIANASVRLRILKQCQSVGIEPINVIHPQAYISPTVKIGEGNYIKAGAIIETNTVIGNCCIIDNGVVIAHDNVISDGCHIAPCVAMGSNVRIDQKTIIGIGASIATGVTIGQSVIISVGTSVIKNIPDYSIVEGVPGKVIGKRKKEYRAREKYMTQLRG